MSEKIERHIEFRIVSIPRWALPIGAAASVMALLFASLLGLAFLLFAVPVIVVTALATRWLGMRSRYAPFETERRQADLRHGCGKTIDGDFEILDETPKHRH